ncbi:MAG: hypothetical protein ACK56F_16275 [bacterium]
MLAMSALDNALREVKVLPDINCLDQFLDAAFSAEELNFVGASGTPLREQLLTRVS